MAATRILVFHLRICVRQAQQCLFNLVGLVGTLSLFRSSGNVQREGALIYGSLQQ